MTKEEYNDRMRVIEDNYFRAVDELKSAFALSNSPYGIGDKLKGSVINRITVHTIGIDVICMYHLENSKSYLQWDV